MLEQFYEFTSHNHRYETFHKGIDFKIKTIEIDVFYYHNEYRVNNGKKMIIYKNLIKNNHDGIIVTKKDNIVFSNQQVNSIFSIPKVKENCDNNNNQ